LDLVASLIEGILLLPAIGRSLGVIPTLIFGGAGLVVAPTGRLMGSLQGLGKNRQRATLLASS